MHVVKMKLGFLAIAIVGFFLTIMFLNQIDRADEPSLAQTLNWMAITYNSHESGSPGYGLLIQHTSADGNPFYAINESFTYKNCDMTIILKMATFRDGPGDGVIPPAFKGIDK